MAWEFATDPTYEAKLSWARAFLREWVEPLETLALDQATWQRVVAHLQGMVREQGLWAAHLPPEHGGGGFGQVRLGLLNEITGRSPLGPVIFGSQAPDAGNAEILALAGTKDQRRRYLEPLIEGRKRSAFAMTELETAGADPTLLRCRATLDRGEWVVDGEKWFITNASVADFLIVMVVTDPDAGPHRRASTVIVDAGTPGLTIEREIGSMEKPSPDCWALDDHAVVRFRSARVPADNLLGARGDGFAIAQQRLGPGRIHHCMRWLGQAQRALDMLCERALYRYSHGAVLADKQTVQNWIADSSAEISAARLLTLHAAWVMDTQGVHAAREEIGTIKFFGARVLHDVIDRALQAHGSLGYSTDLPLEAMYRRARAARLYDGPDEVHRQSVARLVLRDYAPPPDAVPREHVGTRRREALRRFADLLAPTAESSPSG